MEDVVVNFAEVEAAVAKIETNYTNINTQIAEFNTLVQSIRDGIWVDDFHKSYEKYQEVASLLAKSFEKNNNDINALAQEVKKAMRTYLDNEASGVKDIGSINF